MGLCHDFGSPIAEHCTHPMRAGANSCTCDECGVVCTGLFDACSDVWARGPHPVLLRVTARPARQAPVVAQPANGQRGSAPRAESAVGAGPHGAAPVGESRTDPPRHPGEVVRPTVDARTEVVRWFEHEFGVLRAELAGLREVLRGQEGASEAVDAAKAGALPALVDDAVGKAVANHLSGLEQSIATTIRALRREMKEVRLSNERAIGALRDAVAESRAAPSQLVPLAEAAAESAAHSESLLTDLAEAVADSASHSAAEMAALRRRLDRVTQAPASPPVGAVIARLGLAAGDPSVPSAGERGQPAGDTRALVPDEPSSSPRASSLADTD